MPTDRHAAARTSARINGPAELLQAIPYLLGFHPLDSLVLVGLHDGRLVVTARLDLADAADAATIAHTVTAMRRGGAASVVGAVYDSDRHDSGPSGLSSSILVPRIAAAAVEGGCELVDLLLVAGRRWWSLCCSEPTCCPRAGRELPDGPTAFTAAATVDGIAVLPDRAALAAVLEPLPDPVRGALEPLLAHFEDAAAAAVLAGHSNRAERSVKRALFAAARAAVAPGWTGPSDATVARFGVALGSVPVRDAAWMAIDDGRLPGRVLWRDLARRLPSPYDATPLFLFGWAAWRAGDGALANIAADRAVASDPNYSAADLLLAALAGGVDPRRLPKLRQRRPA